MYASAPIPAFAHTKPIPSVCPIVYMLFAIVFVMCILCVVNVILDESGLQKLKGSCFVCFVYNIFQKKKTPNIPNWPPQVHFFSAAKLIIKPATIHTLFDPRMSLRFLLYATLQTKNAKKKTMTDEFASEFRKKELATRNKNVLLHRSRNSYGAFSYARNVFFQSH